MAPWSDDRVWDAVDDWRWIPPGARRERTDEWDLAVTPGSYALTYVYDFRVDDPRRTDERLLALQERIVALGGTGARLQVTPRSRPADLPDRLARRGYRPREDAEVLVFDLRDDRGGPRLPAFPEPEGIEVREVLSEADYRHFTRLGTEIFGDPAPSPETGSQFLSAFQEQIRAVGHSDRFLAWDGPIPIGRGGLERAGPVARLWGSGVLPNHRHRGAYGAIVRVRCRSVVDRGAEIALVIARTGTSGPILKRHGFRRVGAVSIWEIRF